MPNTLLEFDPTEPTVQRLSRILAVAGFYSVTHRAVLSYANSGDLIDIDCASATDLRAAESCLIEGALRPVTLEP